MRRALLVLMFLLTLIPVTAAAQLRRFEITPFAGYRLSSEFDDFGFDNQSDLEIEEAMTYGLIFEVPLSRYWQLELLASRQSTSLSADRGLLSPADDLGDVDLNLVQGGFLLQWGDGQVIPFVVGTLGIARLDPDFSELDTEDYLSGTFGGGVKIFFSDNVGLRLEGRGTWIDLGNNYHDHHGGYYDDYYDGVTWMPEGSAGIIFSW